MNYAHYASWIRERVEDLVEFGVPRGEAEAAMHYVEIAGINAEAQARRDDQLLLDFKAIGGKALAERLGVSPQTVLNRRRKILHKKTASLPFAIGG